MRSKSGSSAKSPSAKRIRHTDDNSLTAPPSQTSHLISKQRLFAPFRALGIISNDVPFVLQTRFGGKDATKPDINVITCLGDSWAMWEAERMTLLFVSPSLAAPISSLAISTSPDSVLAAAGNKVYRFVRGKTVAIYDTVDKIFVNSSNPADGDDNQAMQEDDDTESLSSSSSSSSSTTSSPSSSSINNEGTPLSTLLVFGDSIVSLAVDGKSMFIWSLATTELVRKLEFPSGFTATSMVHPATYLNKVLVGSSEGGLQVWNIRTGSLIHSFDSVALKRAAGGSPSNGAAGDAMVCLSQSPAVDVVAIGFADGDVLLQDIRLNESLLALHVDGGLSTGSISFRTDGKAHSVAVASNSGNISIFDLQAPSNGPSSSSSYQGPKLSFSIRDAHESPVGSIEFVPGQPLLVSSSGDNSFKQWFFESPAMPPRLLKMRSGHHQPPHLIRYYGEEGKDIISAARDQSIRCISVVRDSRSHELSQGSLQKRSNQLAVSVSSLKLPPASSISFSTTRSRDWDDVLTTHHNQQFAHTWFLRDKRMNATALAASHSKKIPAEARTGCVSACGNFGLVGNSQGLVEAYNMQSSLHRRTYDTRPTDPLAEQRAKQFAPGSKKYIAALKARGQASAITAVVSDALNRHVIASTLDGKLFYFDFTSTELLHTSTLAAGISSIQLDQESNLMMALCDDLVLRLIDIETRKVVREFTGFRGRLLDATFSNDGRWIVTTSMDSVIRTFDIPSARMIDAFKTASIATSVTFSPTGDFLATAHVDSVGIYLWANKIQFTNVSLRGLNESAEVVQGEGEGEEEEEEEIQVQLPSVQGIVEDEALALLPSHLDIGEPELQRNYTSPPQLSDDESGSLVTFSTMPRARWMTLLHLDLLQRRNKSKQPIQKSTERAPFFLPQTAGTTFQFDTTTSSSLENKEEEEQQQQQRSRKFLVPLESEFIRHLRSCIENRDASPFFTYLHTLSTSTVDIEIRSLTSLPLLSLFLQILSLRIQQHLDYEAVQALLHVFLSVHSDMILQNDQQQGEGEDEEHQEVTKQLSLLLSLFHDQHARIIDLLDHCLGTLSFLRNLPMT